VVSRVETPHSRGPVKFRSIPFSTTRAANPTARCLDKKFIGKLSRIVLDWHCMCQKPTRAADTISVLCVLPTNDWPQKQQTKSSEHGARCFLFSSPVQRRGTGFSRTHYLQTSLPSFESERERCSLLARIVPTNQ
jgi:hypothetical protein